MAVPVMRPSYWASVSGGKDSLYMLKLIIDNNDLYPLDGVVHFELEIDFPFIKNVVDYMERICTEHGIKFVRIKPRHTWAELYELYGFPTRKVRWCNSKYKLDAKRQLEDYLKSQGRYCVSYIGYCADESARFSGRRDTYERYPIVDFGITEDYILKWAKTQPIFNRYYLTQKRCGCMYCPLASGLNFAYLAKYYPDYFESMIYLMHNTEVQLSDRYGKPFSVTQSNGFYDALYLRRQVVKKWLPMLNDLELGATYEQLSLWGDDDDC